MGRLAERTDASVAWLKGWLKQHGFPESRKIEGFDGGRRPSVRFDDEGVAPRVHAALVADGFSQALLRSSQSVQVIGWDEPRAMAERIVATPDKMIELYRLPDGRVWLSVELHGDVELTAEEAHAFFKAALEALDNDDG